MTEPVSVYTCVVRTDAKHQKHPDTGEVVQVIPASISVEEKDFHAAHWASAMGRAIPKGKQPSDPMPIERPAALELVNRWNRYSDHGQDGQEVKYWIK